MPTKENLKGKKFGRLLVIRETDSKKVSTRSKVWWLCLCDCGEAIETHSQNLKNGATKSCGCLRRDLLTSKNYKHGDAINDSRLYKIWRNMKTRCNNPNNTAYKRYGGRGIEICLEWKSNYIAFKAWALKNGYNENLTIDRIENNGNYEPSNCRWLPKSENSRRGARIGRT